MKVTTAQLDEVDIIVQWRHMVTAWLADEVGSDQWSNDIKMPPGTFYARVAESIAAGHTLMAREDDDTPVGTMAVDTWSDPGLWSPAELDDMVIVHRMIVPRDHAGRGIGTLLLQAADRYAAALGRHWIGADVWTTNEKLHDYYRRQGFIHVRTACVDWPSAALFRRPVVHHE